ncbi:MAG: hypothetical protein KDE27_13885, partial [Planctomycetes bacterium]|nr:hypothetical protein [Planctomycetota bacterium]
RRGAGDPQPERVIATATALATQFGALAFDFEDEDATAPGASRDFPEPEAVVVDGALTVPDAFPPLADVGDWTPNGADTTLRTDVQTLYYQNGRQRTFEGGVLHVKELHIGPNQIVRGLGPNPLVLVVDGDARIDGALTVRGANADRLFVGGTYRGPGDVSPPPAIGSGHGPIGPNPDPFVPVGAAAGAGGGRGGATSTLAPRTFGSPGESAPGTDGGGRGGTLVAQALGQASGGGGGAGAVTGDPWFPSPAGPGDLFPQRAGRGGAGIGRTLPGGAAGTPWFTNATAADDFWGRAWVPRERRAIVGELAAPVGGSGGGAGGALDLPGWFYYLGGDGGGGGGALVLRVRGTLTLGPQGRIDADGGHGSGTEYLYSTERMGGGGGGAGGMVVLMAGDGIVIHTHGGTFANRDYDFPISADGGICRSSSFGPWYFRSKYPQNGQPTFSGSQYDDAPLGGFGGMGLVQLMVPVGRSNDDDTNTVLDDAITIVRNGVPLRGLAKQRFLGWRGFPDENGVLVDDFGNPTGTIGGQGDIRPDPVLLPVPFATHGTARAQSGWLP